VASYTEHSGGKAATNEDNNKARTNKGKRKKNRTTVNLLKRQKERIKKESVFTKSST